MKTDKVILGEVESLSELARAVAFLRGFGLVVDGHPVTTSEAELRPGKDWQESSTSRFLIVCDRGYYEKYKTIFAKCSAGYNSGEDRMERGKVKTSPALWEVLPTPTKTTDSAAGTEIAKLRQALVFYSRQSNYENSIITHYDYNDGFHTTTSAMQQDRGEQARKALL